MATASVCGKSNYRNWLTDTSSRSRGANLPLGTIRWNKIEHRLFSFISITWRGKPLRSFRTIVELIAATTTDTGLTVRAELDEKKYPKGLKISDAQLATVNIFPHDFHGEWNYTIAPNKKRREKGLSYFLTSPKSFAPFRESLPWARRPRTSGS